ncbi:MAG: C_GCAxxG_C_C family protein [Chloroflexi bacterium]|nr:C_GCAxxG_C_C family protein [Chloroflexota bacterium]
MIDKAYSLAYEYEQRHGNCPQCVLAAMQEVFGAVDDEVFKAAHGLAGGAALSTKGTCGALTGAMLAISSKYGRDRQSFARGGFSASYKLSKRLLDQFVAEFGSPICQDIQTKLLGRSFDMWDRNDYKAFELAGGHTDKCPAVAGKAAMWTAELLLEEQDRKS